MAQEATFETLHKNAERAVEKTVKQTAAQARGALDGYFDFVQKAVSSYPSGGTEFGEKLKSFTEENISAAKEFVDALSKAKDFQDVVRIQTEYMQSQFSSVVAQSKGLNEAFTKTITSEVKMPMAFKAF
jgi:hypothetical protein